MDFESAGQLTALAAVASVVIVAFSWYKGRPLQEKYKLAVEKKKHQRKQQMQELRGILDEVSEETIAARQAIVALDFHSLREKLQSGELSATRTVDAFRWKAMEAHEKFNCVTEFVREAEDLAAELDVKFKNLPKPPLFGMPFSVKDNFWMKGYDSCRGLGKEAGVLMEENNAFVVHLQSLGAVPIVRTCVPQTLLQYNCSSPVYGTTCNPYDVTRTSGGSSGGEASLLAAGGTSFAIGSDLGGSLRIPAHFCGLCSLKPGGSRLVSSGAHPGVPGACRLGLSYGFFTKDVKTLNYLMELAVTEEYALKNPPMSPVPYGGKRSDFKGKRLNIGYFDDDGFFPAVPACRRAVAEALKALEKEGFTLNVKPIPIAGSSNLLPFTLPDPEKALSIFIRCISPDNGAFLMDSLKHDEIDQFLKPAVALLKIPICIRGLVGKLLKKWYPEVALVAGSYNGSVVEVRENYAAADAYRKQFLAQWKEMELDALICPAFPFPAIQHDGPPKLMAAAFITGLFNLLDYPAGVVPITKVTAEDEKSTQSGYPSEEAVASSCFSLRYPLHHLVREGMKGSAGLPVGVQVVTQPFQEELAVHIMSLLEKNVNFH